jgi:hypothetical protein
LNKAPLSQKKHISSSSFVVSFCIV